MLQMPDNFFASPVWLYVASLLTWCCLLLLATVFKRRVAQMIQFVSEQTATYETDKSRDRLIGGGLGVGAFSLLVLLDANLIFALVVGLAIFALTPMVLRRRRFALYQKAFDESLVESLATLASSLRAGLTLKDSMVVAVQNCPPVFAAEIARALKDYRFGKSMDAALDQIRKRVQTQNANIAFGALIIGTQLGGRIPEVLTRIVQTIREVDRVEGRLKALTAQGRAQGALLCSMPVLIGVGMYFLDRDKIDLMMASPVGKVLIGLVVFLELVGIIATLRVMKLDV